MISAAWTWITENASLVLAAAVALAFGLLLILLFSARADLATAKAQARAATADVQQQAATLAALQVQQATTLAALQTEQAASTAAAAAHASLVQGLCHDIATSHSALAQSSDAMRAYLGRVRAEQPAASAHPAAPNTAGGTPILCP